MTRLVPPSSGWTKTPNRYLEATARAGAALPARHRSILDFLLRKVFGWRLTTAAVSQRAIARRLGVSTRTVREALGDLEYWRVIRRRGRGQGRVAWVELLEPEGWRITRTRGATRRERARRLKRSGNQLLLPLPGVASVVELPDRAGVTSRDTVRDTSRDTSRSIPRGLGRAPLREEIKKQGRPKSSRIAPEDRMPNDDPLETRPSAEEISEIRRLRAARLRIRRQGLGNPFDPILQADVAAALSSGEVDAEIERRELELAAQARAQRERRKAESMRHEGRR